MVLATDTVFKRITESVQELSAEGARKFGFRAMGTRCEITVGAESRVTAEQFKLAAIRWVAEFEAKYSRFLPDSIVSRINQNAGVAWTDVDEETDRFLTLAQELYFFTRGAFDPTALPLIRLWDWKAVPPVVPSDAAIAKARELVGLRKIQRRKGGVFLPQPGMCIDFGGIGKEYAVDRVTELAVEHGVKNALIDFGQDVRVLGQAPGKPAWHIGLEDPNSPGRCWTGLAVRDMAVATSGDYLRCFQVNGRRYGHIIDPRSGRPVENGCRAVSIVAPSCTVAGVLSTTAFILGPTEGLNLISAYVGAEGCILTDNARHQTRKFHEYLTR